MNRTATPNALLRKARKEQGWTQRQLAYKVGVEEQTVRTWELGTRSPGDGVRARLCTLFSKTPQQLGLQPTDEALAVPEESRPPAAAPPLAMQGPDGSARGGDANRQRMLERVASRWIRVLDHSLYRRDLLIVLGLHEQPDAVTNPWGQVTQESNLPPRPLPASTPITDAYDSADGELLILGEPGCKFWNSVGGVCTIR